MPGCCGAAGHPRPSGKTLVWLEAPWVRSPEGPQRQLSDSSPRPWGMKHKPGERGTWSTPVRVRFRTAEGARAERVQRRRPRPSEVLRGSDFFPQHTPCIMGGNRFLPRFGGMPIDFARFWQHADLSFFTKSLNKASNTNLWNTVGGKTNTYNGLFVSMALGLANCHPTGSPRQCSQRFPSIRGRAMCVDICAWPAPSPALALRNKPGGIHAPVRLRTCDTFFCALDLEQIASRASASSQLDDSVVDSRLVGVSWFVGSSTHSPARSCLI